MAPAPLELPIGTSPSRARVLRRWLIGTFCGRVLALGALLKLVAFLLGAVAGSPERFQRLDAVGDIGLVVGAAILASRLFVDLKRRVLWRVRRKLTLSYIFIGFVPALLLITFFLVAGVLLLNNVSSHVVHTRVEELVSEAELLARTAAVGIEDAGSLAEATGMIERQQAAASARHPQVSYALVAAPRACGAVEEGSGVERSAAVSAGRWAHTNVPAGVPSWIPCEGYAGLVFDGAVIRAEDGGAPDRLLARAVARPGGRFGALGLIVDLPMTDAQAESLRTETGIELLDVDAARGQAVAVGESPAAATRAGGARSDAPAGSTAGGWLWQPVSPWIAFFDSADWESGETVNLALGMRSNLVEVAQRITPVERLGEATTNQVLIIVLVAIGGLLLIIQLVALGMGLGLARSITGSVHELFVGTQRVQDGEWTYRIPIRSRDQLGALADSFNEMTKSVEELLHQKDEKERLEQELLIARRIQMSLLPQGTFEMAGLALTAHCEPAREVGGDYYDYLPIDDDRLGILIADVSGKGTSAALYMAELKGIVLSLSQFHASPRDLLIDANRIISRHLDARSFITVTYVVVDLRQRTLRYARAGHCPLIYMPGPQPGPRIARILAPDGMVVGLQLDEGQMFTRLLEEATIPLGPGDLFVFYTDGITEAMNAEGDIFGDDRLAALVSGHADLPDDELRERILRDVRAFAGSTVQQDDMTMVLLRMEDAGVSA